MDYTLMQIQAAAMTLTCMPRAIRFVALQNCPLICLMLFAFLIKTANWKKRLAWSLRLPIWRRSLLNGRHLLLISQHGRRKTQSIFDAYLIRGFIQWHFLVLRFGSLLFTMNALSAITPGSWIHSFLSGRLSHASLRAVGLALLGNYLAPQNSQNHFCYPPIQPVLFETFR